MNTRLARSARPLCRAVHEALERRILLASVAISDFSPPDSGVAGEAFALGEARYYAFNDGVRGYELWRSDPAHPSGRLVRDININVIDGSGRTGSSHPTSFFALGQTLLFIADDGLSGRELWRSDGSAAGTQRLIESTLGSGGIRSGTLDHAAFQGGALVLASPQIFYTDGTVAGTRRLDRVEDVKMFLAAGRLYWLDATRRHVMSFDGTTLAAAFSLPASLSYGGQSLAIDEQGRLVFTWYVWTPLGRQWDHRIIAADASELARESVSHPEVGVAPQIGAFVGSHGNLAFYSISGRGLWATDGTAAGLRPILPESAGRASTFVSLDSQAYFMLEPDGAGNRRELWRTDGTAAATQRIAQIDQQDRPGNGLWPLVAHGGRLIFAAGASDRWELRAFTPATSTTEVLAVVTERGADVVISGGWVFFRSYDPSAGEAHFYRSDGTSAGTSVVYRRSGWISLGAPEAPLLALGERLIIVPLESHLDQVLDPQHAFVVPGPATATHRFIRGIRVGETVFLRYDEAVAGAQPTFELWRTNGTATGTMKLIDLPHQASNAFAAFGDLLLFTASGVDGNEIYRSDGTKNGTYRLRDIHPTGNSDPLLIGSTRTAHFFIADDGVNGRSLWKTDGLFFGTVLLKSFGGRMSGQITAVTAMDEAIYFIADDGIHGRQLWRSDGTPTGTYIVRAGAATGSQLTGAPRRAGGLLVAPGFTPGDGAELFALDVSAPALRPITAPYIRNRQLHVFGTDTNDVIRAQVRVPAGGAGGAGAGVLEVLVNDAMFAYAVADFSVLRIFAGGGHDLVDVSDITLPTSVIGASGNDTIRTGAGRDTLYGGDGDDALYGGADNDYLWGQAGNDRLNGGGGRDILWGGAGQDTFVSSLSYERRDLDLEDLLR